MRLSIMLAVDVPAQDSSGNPGARRAIARAYLRDSLAALGITIGRNREWPGAGYKR
jgi:hypothetical protein